MAGRLAGGRYSAAAGIRVLALDGDAIVFNAFSWETHLLNPAAALILDLAVSTPCSEADVRNVLAEVLDDGERPHADEHARRLLTELIDLRLLVAVARGDDEGR